MLLEPCLPHWIILGWVSFQELLLLPQRGWHKLFLLSPLNSFCGWYNMHLKMHHPQQIYGKWSFVDVFAMLAIHPRKIWVKHISFNPENSQKIIGGDQRLYKTNTNPNNVYTNRLFWVENHWARYVFTQKKQHQWSWAVFYQLFHSELTGVCVKFHALGSLLKKRTNCSRLDVSRSEKRSIGWFYLRRPHQVDLQMTGARYSERSIHQQRVFPSHHQKQHPLEATSMWKNNFFISSTGFCWLMRLEWRPKQHSE